MKKALFSLLFAMVVFSCAQQEELVVDEPDLFDISSLSFNFMVNSPEDAKAVKTGWENGDIVYIFFKGLVGENKYAIFTYDGSSWTKSPNGMIASDFSGLGDKQLIAVYFPFGTPTFTASGDKYNVTAEQSYYLSVNTSYTDAIVDESLVITAELNMTVPDGFVQFSMPITDGTITFFRETPEYTLTESNLAPVSVTAITPGSAPTQTEITGDNDFGQPVKGYFYGTAGTDRCIIFSGILKNAARGNSVDYHFTFVNKNSDSYDYDDVTYYFDRPDLELYRDGGTSWHALMFPFISDRRWKVPEPGYVTVGGIKWATCNIGATNPWDYGDYYTLGAVYPQASYQESDYHEHFGETYHSAESLDSAHDVAYQKLGSSWRIPMNEEMVMGLSRATKTWTSQNGVPGLEITGTDGTLFMPATTFWGWTFSPSSGAALWTSTFTSQGAHNVSGFFCFSEGGISGGAGASYLGLPVRPVYDPSDPAIALNGNPIFGGQGLGDDDGGGEHAL